jgi:hypothetical protein
MQPGFHKSCGWVNPSAVGRTIVRMQGFEIETLSARRLRHGSKAGLEIFRRLIPTITGWLPDPIIRCVACPHYVRSREVERVLNSCNKSLGRPSNAFSTS